MLDDIDRRLIALLRTDARTPLSRLAEELSVARATVQNRLNRLQAAGVILGFTVRLPASAEPHPIQAVMMVEVEGRRTSDVLKTLAGFPQVTRLHTTNGRWDLVAELATEDLPAFDRFLHQVREIEGIASTETSLFLSAYKM